MEKSNSFKRVLAGTLALLTVASSVPADAGSVIGNFFSTSLVADAANTVKPTAESGKLVAVTNVAVSGSTGTAKVTVNGTTKDATIEVTTPNAEVTNVKSFKITCEGAFGNEATSLYATVENYTVVEETDVPDVTADGVTTVYNAKNTDANTLTLTVNEYQASEAWGKSEFTYNGKAQTILFGKDLMDESEAAIDGEDNNTVEIAYKTSASTKPQVIQEELLTNPDLFTWTCETATGAGEKVGKDNETNKNVCKIMHVNRDADGKVIPHIIKIAGKKNTAYAGLEFDAQLLIDPLNIDEIGDQFYTVESNIQKDYSIARIVYDGTKATGDKEEFDGEDDAATPDPYADGNREYLKTVSVDDDLSGAGVTELEEGGDFTVTYAPADDTTALSAADGDNIADDAVNVGKYKATLNFTGNYTGAKNVYFRIVPAEVSLTDLTTDGDVVTLTGDNTTEEGVSKTKVFNRASERLVNAKTADNDPYGLDFKTYKAEVDANGDIKVENDQVVYSSTATTNYKDVGQYKTVITATGNYKNAFKKDGNDKRTNEDVVAEVVWTVTPYSINGDKIVIEANATIDKSTGNVVPQIVVQDKQEVVESTLTGANLIQGTEYTVKYSTTLTGEYKDTVPAAKDLVKDATDGKYYIYAKITGIGNYMDTTVAKKIEVGSAEYEATSATLTTKTTEGYEKVRYQYGDNVDAKVTTAPAALSQEVRYYAVDLTDTGAADIYNAKGEIIDETLKGIITGNVITDSVNLLTADDLAARANADTPEGYVAVVFVNNAKKGDGNNNDSYNPLFESKTAITKAFTVDKRTVSQNSTVAVEFVNPLLPYKGSAYSELELMNNINKVTVDGKVIYTKDAETPLTDGDLETAPFRLADIDKVTYKDVDSYSIKLIFDAVAAPTDPATTNDTLANTEYDGNSNITGSYTTDAKTQGFNIVATQLTAADFNVNGVEIMAVYTKEGLPDQVIGASDDPAVEMVTVNGEKKSITDHGYTLAYYKAVQTVVDENADGDGNARTPALVAGAQFKYDGKAWTIPVTSTKYADVSATTGLPTDYEVTGVTQTDAGPYELTIKGVKNTKGTVTVKWSVDGNTFKGFTATPDKTTFTYNGKAQTPAFTLTKTENNATVTLTEGKDFVLEYYVKNGDQYTKQDATPKNVGTYYAKIVGTGAYYGAVFAEDSTADYQEGVNPAKMTQFTIAPSTDLSIKITPKTTDFSYNGQALKDRIDDLFEIEVDGKKLDTDEIEHTYHITTADGKDATNAKNAGKYKLGVTIYNDNYQPKTSDQKDFEITPKEIVLSNIKANVKTAVYGAPVAQINESITFDYDGVLEEDADKVSVDDFRGFVVVSNNYRSGSPAGEYTLTYNGDFVPATEAAKNYKAKKFSDTEKITIAKKDLADAKANVTLVIVPSEFTNDDPERVEEGQELKANQIVYNGKPYEVYIQKNDNGLMTMSDLDFSGTPKALHAGSDYELVATASADGNYTGTATLELTWGINKYEIKNNVEVTVSGWTNTGTDEQPNWTYGKIAKTTGTDNLSRIIPTGTVITTDAAAKADKNHNSASITTDVQFYSIEADGSRKYTHVEKNAQGVVVNETAPNAYASEAAGDYTVYFTQLDEKGEPIESTKTTGYPTVAGSYRAEVEFSDDFVKGYTSAPNDDPEFVPQLAQIGHVDFTIAANKVNAVIYDLNQLQDDADLNDDDSWNDNKATAFTRVYGDAITPNFQVDIKGKTGDALVTAKVDITKMRKYVADETGTVVIDGQHYKLSDAVYDGTAGLYDLQGAIITNDPDWTVNLYNVFEDKEIRPEPLFTVTNDGALVYTVERSTDYTIQFAQDTNKFELKDGVASADFKVIDNNSGKEMVKNVDYKIKGGQTVYKTGKQTLFVQGIGNYTSTASADWLVVAAGEDTSVNAKFYAGNTVSFKDQVEFNFFADIDENYVDGAYVVFTYDHYGTKTEVKKMISKSDTLKDKNGTHYRVRLPLTASEMAIDVKAELFLKNTANSIDTKTRSIKDYAEAAINLNLDGADVLKAMLNYGGYTQVALKNNTNLLANASADIKEDVSAIQPKSQSTFVRPTPYEGTTTVGGWQDIPQSVKIKFTPTVTYKGTTVMTKSMLYVRHYFTVDSSVDQQELEEITVAAKFNRKTGAFTNDYQEYKLVDLPKNSTGYYLDMPAEMAYNLDKDRGTVRVYNFPGTVTNVESYTDGANTVAAGSKTYKVGARVLQNVDGHNYADYNDYRDDENENEFVETDIYAIEVKDYNVVDYCEAIANNAKQSTNNKNMVKALYKYYQAAEAYVAKRS